jgi:hypothetical protein
MPPARTQQKPEVATTRDDAPDEFIDAWIAEHIRGSQVVVADAVETMKTTVFDRLGLEVIEVELEDARPPKRGAKREPVMRARDSDSLPLDSEVADMMIVETPRTDPPSLGRLMSEAVRVVRPQGRLMLLVPVPAPAEDIALAGAMRAILQALPPELEVERLDAQVWRVAMVASIVDANDAESIEQRLVRELTRTVLRASELEQIVRDVQEGIARRDRLLAPAQSNLTAERAARAQLASEHDVVQERLALRAKQVTEYRADRWYRLGRALWRARHWRRRSPKSDSELA